jgi:hypothetical protein
MTNRSLARSGTAALILLLAFRGGARAAVVHLPIKSGLELTPNAAYTVTIQSTQPVEIGWQAVQSKPCTTNCVQATDLSGGINEAIATPLGASAKYVPVSGKISIEYKNVSREPVTIDIYRVQRTCEAEACRFLGKTEENRWLVFKVDEFLSITTSQDGSYSVISGIAASGRPFTFTAVWWTDDKNAFRVDCSPFIKRYLERHIAKDQYRPYVISGQAFGDPARIVLRSIDTCAARAPKFGVPDSNVFK